jgi:hypothetical protein
MANLVEMHYSCDFWEKRRRRKSDDPEKSERTDAGIVAVSGGTPGVPL